MARKTISKHTAFRHCSKSHTRHVNGRIPGGRRVKNQVREFYYHATKGWRSRAI